MPTRRQVARFLDDFKTAVSYGYADWLARPAERQHLIDLGITQNRALEYIQELTPDNYVKGPEPDHVNPGRDVWVFGCDVAGVEAYIKLALQPHNTKQSVVYGVIWSFHAAEFPLRYPIRGE